MLLYLVLAGLVKEWLSLPTGATWSTLLTSSMALNWVVEGSSCTRRVEVGEGLARGRGRGQGLAAQGGAETPGLGRAPGLDQGQGPSPATVPGQGLDQGLIAGTGPAADRDVFKDRRQNLP